ncbi:hypothetical protein HELRODRAFT_193752 [Helobdella robusta]|uniref:Innexin n=1 Tax=Helobdella robusta TaxID=6412 RepID=T1FVB5_HELRO|nr:hypothetical protein HELRODRAFT_193752 [Helobdella robusta]ESN94877.1 hypothetical protein HELRODRAFT_193752 [Helobdella robusta]
MASLVATAVKMAGGNDRFDDTITDRVNHVTTTAMLVVMATLVTTTNFVGNPIECFVPKELSKTHVQYFNTLCWINGMYNVSFDTEYIPSARRNGGRKATILYYPWIPLILLGMALMYSLPCLVWRSFQAKSGFDVSNFVDYGFKVSSPKIKNDVRDTLLDHMTLQFERYLSHSNKSQSLTSFSSDDRNDYSYSRQSKWTISFKHLFTKTCFKYIGHKRLNYFSALKILVKFLYVVNSIVLIFLLDVVLGVSFHNYGTDIIKSLFAWNFSKTFRGVEDVRRTKQYWKLNELDRQLNHHQEIRFPKVTMCDVKVRWLAVVNTYSVQCALPNNLFNEKIFLILWFWMVFVAALNIASLIRWVLKISVGKDRYNYVKNLLLLSGLISHKSKPDQKSKQHFDIDATSNISKASDLSDMNANSSSSSNNIYDKRTATTSNTASASISNAKRPLTRLVNNNPSSSIEDNTSFISTILTNQQLNERMLLLKFVKEHLGTDGVLLLHILDQATNTIVAMEMVEKLWINFRERYETILQQQEDITHQKYLKQQRVHRV